MIRVKLLKRLVIIFAMLAVSVFSPLLSLPANIAYASRSSLQYSDYKNENIAYGFADAEILIKGSEFSSAKAGEITVIDGIEAVKTTDDDFVEWKFTVPKTGLYSAEVLYYPLPGTGGAIERSIYIDGVMPFDAAYAVEFSRIYVDTEPIVQAKSGDIRPEQDEAPRFRKQKISDRFTYHGDAVYFLLTEGEHTISFESIKEPMAVAEIKLVSKASEIMTYSETLEKWENGGAKKVTGALTDKISVYQCETPYEKSDPTLYPISDITSCATTPYDRTIRRLNTIGGEQWKNPGQWLSWEIEVPESGLYTLGVRARQNYNSDLFSNRALYIDGTLPFSEAAFIRFTYSDKWKTLLFGDGNDNNNPYYFYLEKGTHVITLKVTAGAMADVLTKADAVLKELNKINLDLLSLMGSSPDTDRDYQLEKIIPDTLESLVTQSGILDGIIEGMKASSDEIGAKISELEVLSLNLHSMIDDTSRVPRLYTNFQTNIGAFANWIISCREMPLALDCIFVAEEGAKLPRAESNFFENIIAEIVRFFASFFTDYSSLSDEVKTDAVTVWIGNGLTGGRDQAIALNKLVSEEFTGKTGIAVNLQLVSSGTILPATLAGKGPDVALQVSAGDPVNYAMRKAVYDLSQFSDFEETAKRFFPSSLTPFEYNGGTYAIPETFSFPMMFYREDILSDLGIDVNNLKTWQDIINILPLMQRQNMNFGISANVGSYFMFLYQMGGSVYSNDLKSTNLGSEEAVTAFKMFTEFYNDYGMPKDFNFQNRFRTGEMPIAVVDYTSFNMLSVAAPEIKGLWSMSTLPGIRNADGEIINVAPSSVSGAIIMSGSKYKENAWEFLKWWTDENAQFKFGQELETVMGIGARYNTANIAALSRLPWSHKDKNSLLMQAENSIGTPEVPGGYYTGRYFEFAMWTVLDDKTEPRQSLYERIDEINSEIKAKRTEFGLDN